MKNKERLVSLIMATVISVVMGLLFAFLVRVFASPEELAGMPPAPVMYISSLIESLIVGIIVILIIPIGKLGKAFAAKFNARPGSFKFNIINSFTFAVINAIIVSGVCSFIGIAQSHAKMPPDQAPPLMIMWLNRWLLTVPISIVVSFVLALIISPIVVRAVGLGKPPKEMMQGREEQE